LRAADLANLGLGASGRAGSVDGRTLFAVYEDLPTESVAPEGPELDRLDPGEIARLLHREEVRAAGAVGGALASIGEVCRAAAEALRGGGRIVYAGAGTSGRLGVLDAAEMEPTFGAPPGTVVALLAGGPEAMVRSVEGAEDDEAAGRAAAEGLGLSGHDLVVGITMSGTAAWVGGVLDVAEAAGAATALVTASASRLRARHRMVLDLGPEALAGSTRLKGGSATKAVLNMISTAAMAASGAVYQNLMVRVRPTNKKLRDRAERIVMRVAEVDRVRAARALRDAGDEVAVAVLMQRLGLDRAAAEARLAECKGSLREALS
jgi:N-acetylmuramic acid 6-phosphate etherase